MSIVAEEFLRQRRLDRAVEEIGCNPVEYGGVAGAQHSIFECHWRIFARSSDWPYSRPGGVAMASWQARTTSFVLRHWFKPRLARTPDALAARKVMSGGSPMPAPRGAQATAATVGGIAGEWMTADGVPTVATLLYLHGGGYFACTPQT